MKLVALISAFIFSGALSAAPKASLQDLLGLKPGTALPKAIPQEAQDSQMSHAIEVENGLVQIIRIEFKSPRQSSEFISKNSSGFCMIQNHGGDVKRERFFFFDQNKHRRYELTLDKKIKAIFIQEIPGASTNTKCTLETFNLSSPEPINLKKTK